ncbi:Ig-like domain-containing protein [Aphelenchoides besseyi]|nr:Ig-like domain-containing protein [Aphelenchoides besseyi]
MNRRHKMEPMIFFFLILTFDLSCADLPSNPFAEGSSFSHWSSEGFGHDSTSSVGFAAKDYFSNGDSSVKSKPRFVPGQWSDCSKTCGSGGIRTRIVHCVGTGVTGERVDLPAFECDGQQRPTLFQPCDLAPCNKNDFKNGVTKSKGASNSQYRWEYGDWGPCSVGDQEVQCLGGKQKSTLKCVDIVQNIAVPWSNCRSKPRPVDLTRACNLKPCAPQWSASQWSECSHSCGGGSRSRNVRCVQRIAPETATDSQLILPDAQCAEQKPAETEACGVVDCEVNWRIGQWTSCSTSCGPGEQRREIVCEQRDRNGMLRTFNPPVQCLGLPRPPTLQLCNLGPCDYNEPNFRYETSNTIGERALPEPLAQLSDQSTTDDNRVRSRFDSPSTVYESRPEHRKLTLNIGGSANLYEGTSIKVKCPVRNFARNRITWTKNGRRIENNAHIKVSSNGALRIFHARQEDAGTYECPAGSVRLRFKPREIGKSEIKDNLETTHELDDVDEPTSANDVDAQLLQKIRESLIRLGERRALDEMRDIREPGKLKVDFLSGDWSLCTQTRCGEPDGTQIRLLRCRILIKQTTAFVDDDICEQFGIVRPPATQTCHANGCPHWEATDWTECSISRCMQQGLSVARREIRCQYSNGTMADFSLCDRRTRPKIKKECPNVNCTAEWKASIWGKCSKDCGDGGVQMRLLRCVWRGTKKPAGGNCEPSLRPAAIKSCSIPDLPECSSESKLWPMDSQSNDSISRLEEQKDERPIELSQQTPPRDLAVQPFNNWQQWRGWRQYNLALPSNLRRLNTMKKF